MLDDLVDMREAQCQIVARGQVADVPFSPAAERDGGQPLLACVAHDACDLFITARLDYSPRGHAIDHEPLRFVRWVSVLAADDVAQVFENGCWLDHTRCPRRRRRRLPWRSPLSFATRPRRSPSRSGRPFPG